MATPLAGATPDTELAPYETPVEPISERHTMHDVGDIKMQMTDLSSAKQSNFEQVLENLGE